MVTLAVLLSVARVLLPGMSEYKSDLENMAADKIGRQVEIESLDAGWDGLSPVLALKQVQIAGQDVNGDPVTVKKVHLALDLWESLLARRWIMRSIDLVGLDVTLYRLVDGQWSLHESATLNHKAPDLDLFFQQHRLGVRDAQITWIDQMQGGLRRVFHDVEAQLINQAYNHRFAVKTKLPVSLGKTLELIGDVNGYGNDPARWTGQIYCKTEALQLHEWMRWMPDLPVSLGGQVSAELWGYWSGEQLSALSGQINGSAFELAMSGSDRPPYQLEKLESRFEWQKTPEGWRANADKVSLYRNEYVDWTDIAMAAFWNSDEQRFKLSANRVPLDELGLITGQLSFVDARLRHWIDRLEPGGLLQDFELDSRMMEGFATPQMSVRTGFTDLSIQAADNVPGISGLAGRLEGNMQLGRLMLDSDALVVLAPSVFNEPKVLVEAAGDINWQRYADRVLVSTPELHLKTAEGITVNTRAQLDWVFAEPAPLLDMQLMFDDFSLDKVQDYLPTGIMSAKLVDWLNTALVSGKVISPRVIFNGRVDQMPFDRGEGIFEADFDVSEAVLDYSPDWGKLENLTAHVQFTGRSLVVHGKQATLQKAVVSDTLVKIENLVRPVLTVKGRAVDTVSDMLKYLMTTPLRNRFGQLVAAVRTRGKAGLDLDLKIPLKDHSGKVNISGNVDFKNSRITDRQGAFDLTNIKGRLHFEEDVLKASNIRARLFGAPVSVALYQAKQADFAGATVLDIKGPMQLVEQLQALGWGFADYLAGNAEWRTRLFFRRNRKAGRTEISLRLDSDMQGIASSLPEPLKKPADKAVPIRVEWDVGEKPGPRVRIHYSDNVSAVFASGGDGRIRAGEAVFGGGEAGFPKDDIFSLIGRIPVLAPLEWAKVFTGGSSKSSEFPSLDFNLRADQIALFGFSVQDVFVKSPASSDWQFMLSGDAAEGSLKLEFDEQKSLQAVNARLERLYLNPPPETDSQSTGQDTVRANSIPDLSIEIADLYWGDLALGKLKLETASAVDGVDIKQLELISSALAVTGKGQWKETGTVSSTRFDINIPSGSLEQLLAVFGDSDAIEKGSLSGSFTATWPGSPMGFSLQDLEGELKLKVGKGRLKDVDTGAGRLLGLLSLQSIPRRLFLDFSDLFKEGYSFDRLEGSFLFSDGNAFTRDLKIYGPAADIEVVGRTGLVSRDYDELISVIPHLTSSLPIAGAIAGGPAVGAVVLLAERLLGDQVNKMSKVQYQVTGSWEDPQYKRFEEPGASSEEPQYDDE